MDKAFNCKLLVCQNLHNMKVTIYIFMLFYVEGL